LKWWGKKFGYEYYPEYTYTGSDWGYISQGQYQFAVNADITTSTLYDELPFYEVGSSI